MSAAKGNAIKLAINCDMGESFGLYKIGDDEGMMPHITIANVACGFHASDPTVMRPHGAAGEAAPRQGRRAPLAARSSGFRPARDEDAARGADRLHRLSGRRAQGVSRTRGHGPVPRQAARLALRHGGRIAGGGEGGRRRRRGVQRAGAGHGRHPARGGLHRRAGWNSSPSTMPISTTPTTAR